MRGYRIQLPRRREAPAPLAIWLASPANRRGGPPPLTPAQQRVATVKQDSVCLTLGMFATSFKTYPLTFTYAAVGEAPEGKADILDVAGPANFSARFVVQRETHLPVMLMWHQPATTVLIRTPGQPAPNPLPPGALVAHAPVPPAATATQEERDQYAATIAALKAANARASQADRLSRLLRRFPRRRRHEVSVPSAARDCRRDDRGNHVRSNPDQREDSFRESSTSRNPESRSETLHARGGEDVCPSWRCPAQPVRAPGPCADADLRRGARHRRRSERCGHCRRNGHITGSEPATSAAMLEPATMQGNIGVATVSKVPPGRYMIQA